MFDLSLRVGERREQLVKELDESVRSFHHRLTGDEAGAVSLKYRRCWPVDRDEFMRKLQEIYEKERQLGATLLSPQKDELEIQNQGRPLRLYGSQGQQRTLALCMRLAEARNLSEHQSEGAILLLDDVFSELDPERRERLLALLPSFAQVLVTTAVPVEWADAATHQVSHGQVRTA